MIELIIRWLGVLIWLWIYVAIVSLLTMHSSKWATVSRVTTQIHVWLWPYAGCALAADLAYAITHGLWGSIVSDVIVLWTWWGMRDWPDDHFKRRRKKITDAVKVVGGRIVVKTAPA